MRLLSPPALLLRKPHVLHTRPLSSFHLMFLFTFFIFSFFVYTYFPMQAIETVIRTIILFDYDFGLIANYIA